MFLPIRGACAVCILLLLVTAPALANNSALIPTESHDNDVVDITEDNEKQVSFVDVDAEPFIATEEWQTVKPGQSVPSGLHIRLNLQTGEKEAKLLNPEASNEPQQPNIRIGSDDSRPDGLKKAMEEIAGHVDKHDSPYEYWTSEGRQGMVHTDKDTFTVDELKAALKKFKSSADDETDDKVSQNLDKKKFRSMAEIKDELSAFNMKLKTDMEIVRNLTAQYREGGLGVEGRVALLEDLEYYLHQIDNAQFFTDLGGLDLVISDLNHSDSSVRSHAAFVLGSACQSNPHVQRAAYEGGAVSQLIRLLYRASSTALSSRCLYALSSLLRMFPPAQHSFLQLGGIETLGLLFTSHGSDKVKVKAVTLINDLLREQVERNQSKESTDTQTSSIDLIRPLLEHGWCDHITSLLTQTDHDAREKVLLAMTSLLDACVPQFTSSLQTLHKLSEEYEELSLSEKSESDGYFTWIASLIRNITSAIYRYSARDEL